MKISAYHKAKGDTVGFNLNNPDKIYASIVFTKKKGFALNNRLDKIPFEIGGSGYNLTSKLPEEIEFIKPDYDLYPSEYSQGFTSRGCNRNCYFCIVNKKEGNFVRWQHPDDFFDERFTSIKLMDNNILFDKMWTLEVLNWCIDHNLDVDMTNGYDVRLIDEDVVDTIIRSTKGIIRIAFDDTGLESIVRNKIQLFKDSGLDIKQKLMVYCYCHDDSMYADTLYRCNVLRELGTNAFVMFNCDQKRTRRIRDLIHWCNRKVLYWTVPFKEYSRLCHT